MRRRTFVLGAGLCGCLATVAYSQDIFAAIGQLLKQLREDDPGHQFASALVDIENAERHFEAALSVNPRAALSLPLTEFPIDGGVPDEGTVAAQMRHELSEAQKYVRNAIFKINRGLESGGGSTEIPDTVREAAQNRNWTVGSYADFYKMIRDALEQLDEILGGEDLGAILAKISALRSTLIEIRTVMNVGV